MSEAARTPTTETQIERLRRESDAGRKSVNVYEIIAARGYSLSIDDFVDPTPDAEPDEVARLEAYFASLDH